MDPVSLSVLIASVMLVVVAASLAIAAAALSCRSGTHPQTMPDEPRIRFSMGHTKEPPEPSEPSEPSGPSPPSNMPHRSQYGHQSDAVATQTVCGAGADRGDKSPGSCCGVAVDGAYVPGTISQNGACQTAVQQDGWANWGQKMPNTYLLSTSGPMVGVSMGGCTVRPISSSGITNYAGFWNP